MRETFAAVFTDEGLLASMLSYVHAEVGLVVKLCEAHWTLP